MLKQSKNKWLAATVIKGSGLGKKLGFPTANLLPPKNFALPYGIYVSRAKLGRQLFDGVLYWGTKGGTGESLEIHLFDFDSQIYGKTLHFKIGRLIREDRKFDSVNQLKKQITEDLKIARRYLYIHI